MELVKDGRLIGNDGKPLFGIHEKPIDDLNIQEFRFHGQEKISAVKNELLKDFMLKRWQYMGVCSRDVIFGIAIVHMGYLSNIFAYAYDRTEKKLREFNTNQPLAANTVFEGNMLGGRTRFHSNSVTIDMENTPGAVKLSAEINHTLEAHLVFSHNAPSLSIVTRVGLQRFNYTNKEAGLPVEGTVKMEGKTFNFRPDVPSGVIDYTFGYLARNTFWNWASGSGLDKNNRKIGFNLVQGVNETGFTENVFWINGKMVKTDVIDFQYNDLDILSDWRIRSNDGKVDLTFHPEGERNSKINLGVIASQFRQPFGRFSGVLRDGWTVCRLRDVSGFTEEHESKW